MQLNNPVECIKKHSLKLWQLPTYIITTASDTEYVQEPNYPNKLITTQLAFSENYEDCLVLEYPTLGLNILQTWNTKCILSSVLQVEEVEKQKVDGYLLWENLSFFAPTDQLAGLFNDFDLCRHIQKFCKQDARIRIETKDKQHSDVLKLPIYIRTKKQVVLQLVFKIVDLGKLSVGGLKAHVEAFGGKMLDKGLMAPYKKNMLEPYLDPTLLPDFIHYSKDDACKLFFLRRKNEERKVRLFEIHNLPIPQKEILTTGTLVAELFLAYLKQYVG
jgi:hypothetical protein